MYKQKVPLPLTVVLRRTLENFSSFFFVLRRACSRWRSCVSVTWHTCPSTPAIVCCCPGLPDGLFSNQKNNLGKFCNGSYWYVLWLLVNFPAIWYIFPCFGTFLPVLVCCTKKNLATLSGEVVKIDPSSRPRDHATSFKISRMAIYVIHKCRPIYLST
jgi:hypothetical protein